MSLNRLLLLCCLSALAFLAQGAPADKPGNADKREPVATVSYELALYFPAPPAVEPLDALKRRLAGGGELPRLVAALPKRPDVPIVMATRETDVARNYAAPSPAMLQKFGRGLTPAQVQALQGARQALILRFAHPASRSLAAYRASLVLCEQLARDTGGLLWDEETREVFTADAWHDLRLATWQGDLPRVSRHTVIHSYPSRGMVRAITLGMAKFGLPDLVVSDFSWSSNVQVGNLMNAVAQQGVEGARWMAPGALALDLGSLRHEAERKHQTSDLKPGATRRARLTLAEGTWEEGDPRNALIEIRFDTAPGADRTARQEATLAGLYGAGEDPVRNAKHDAALLEASRQARAKLPALQQAFARGLQPGEYLMVKAPFATPGGGREWMWVEVTAWQGDSITGLLQNQPRDVPDLKPGQRVRVLQAEVFDYLRRDASGQQEGNTTGKLIEARSGLAR